MSTDTYITKLLTVFLSITGGTNGVQMKCFVEREGESERERVYERITGNG